MDNQLFGNPLNQEWAAELSFPLVTDVLHAAVAAAKEKLERPFETESSPAPLISDFRPGVILA